MQIKFKRLHPDAKLPVRATDGSAAFDLVAPTVAHDDQMFVYMPAGQRIECRTGLACEIPQGYVMLIFSRSGHGAKDGIRLSNCVGVIDSDYRGEIKVMLTKDYDKQGAFPYIPKIHPGDRIAQAVFLKLPDVELVEADELTQTARGVGGFGSS